VDSSEYGKVLECKEKLQLVYLHTLLYKYAVSFDDYADIRRNSKKKGAHLHLKIPLEYGLEEMLYWKRLAILLNILCTTNMFSQVCSYCVDAH
jgi:hypothetical protein